MILWTRVAACVIVFFAEGFQMSLNGPFYPEQAHKKGLDQTKTGLATGTQYVARVFSRDYRRFVLQKMENFIANWIKFWNQNKVINYSWISVYRTFWGVFQ